MKKITSSRDWLDMDLKSQSGAIWTENSNNKKPKKKYKNPNIKNTLLKPDPVKYGNKSIDDSPTIIN